MAGSKCLVVWQILVRTTTAINNVIGSKVKGGHLTLLNQHISVTQNDMGSVNKPYYMYYPPPIELPH